MNFDPIVKFGISLLCCFVCADTHAAVGKSAILPAIQNDRTYEQLYLQVPRGQGTL